MFSEIIRDLRKKQNLRQKDISEILGIAQTTYAGYETGKHEPSIEILKKIADYYNISLDYLTGRYNK